MSDASRRRTAVTVAVVAALGLVATACSSDEGGDEGGATGEGGSTIAVTLQEFAVIPASSSAPAGSITFDVTNEGPEDTHEFVVVKTDLAPDALPTSADGSVDEEGEGIEPVNEIEDIAVGDNPTLTVTLEAGSYALICNVYDESEQESHYQEGMFTGFTVE
jgi:iron uptake system component EfeO